MRPVLAILMLLLSAFCAYGFLASGEPGVAPGWRIGYAVAGLTLLIAAGALLARRRRR